MSKVLVLNNYCLDRVSAEVLRGDKPDHHLYGINRMAQFGFEAEIVPFGRSAGWTRLQRLLSWLRFPIPLGDLGQQIYALRHRAGSALVYAPCQTQTQLLSYLRAIGLFQVPIVTLAHHPQVRGRLRWLRRWFLRWQIRGTDAFPSLSESVAKEIRRLAGPPLAAPTLQWGPDLAYYESAKTHELGESIVAAGRTGRDFMTFGSAAALAGAPAEIYCLRSDACQLPDFGPAVRVTAVKEEGDLSYRQLLPVFARARALAIPLAAGSSMAGLTGLTDALGCGKPVIMTRHPLIDLDVEKEGIGRWVEPGDVKGWTAAISWFREHPEKVIRMGRRARQIAEERLNSARFAHQMTEVFRLVLERSKSSPPKTGATTCTAGEQSEI